MPNANAGADPADLHASSSLGLSCKRMSVHARRTHWYITSNHSVYTYV